ncbi:LysR substrate-binding domain-containing protein [Rhodopseudomonas sp. BAL398]|uniref:LysR substrate-binding domain-containing protein n=1 Tax=Rhodopseudomonas sp. BAL398 TaxID=3034676 RepID=UPI0023E2393A|nr:LysR substrate-binding domain-containing protein [Rhodopseudomonas sp. BAL398]MDF3813662.1 LysR substrate-binding domain-containing protein [Rhodopseudomonas sp. BAL398]
MNLKQLEYFMHVAELGSFSKAALMLDIAQPALSRHVRGLETELRQQLFVRNGRGVVLTEAGKRLFDHSVGIIQLVAQAREDLGASRDAPVGQVTIGLPPSIGRQLTLPLIDRFQRELPAARLAIVEGLSTHIVEWVTTGRIDIGLVYNPDAQAGIEITPLLQEALSLVSRAPKGKRGRAAPPLPIRYLSDYPLIVPERVHAMRRLLETQAALAGVKLDIAWEVSSVPSIIDLVCAGYGHAVLTASGVAASARAAELTVRKLVDPAPVSVLCRAVAAHRRPTPLAQHTMRLLADLVRGLPG